MEPLSDTRHLLRFSPHRQDYPLINKRMSLKENDIVQENLWDRIQELCAEHDFNSARRMALATKDEGFAFLADQMFKHIATEESDYQANQEPDDNTNSSGIDL